MRGWRNARRRHTGRFDDDRSLKLMPMRDVLGGEVRYDWLSTRIVLLTHLLRSEFRQEYGRFSFLVRDVGKHLLHEPVHPSTLGAPVLVPSTSPSS